MAVDGSISCLEGWPQSAKVTLSASKLVPELGLSFKALTEILVAT